MATHTQRNEVRLHRESENLCQCGNDEVLIYLTQAELEAEQRPPLFCVVCGRERMRVQIVFPNGRGDESEEIRQQVTNRCREIMGGLLK